MRINVLRILLTLGFSALVVVLIVHQTYLSKELLGQTHELQMQARLVNSFAKVDRLYSENIDKALSVINRFNRAMPQELKYRIASEISTASMKYENLDVDLICATITHESAFSWNPAVVSPVGALGLMQVMPATGRFLAKVEGVKWTSPKKVLFDPVINIRLGSRYLSSLIELYDIEGGLAAYNGGGTRAKKWLAQNRAKGILYKETQNYVPAVLSLYEEFRN